jgi:acetylornithine/succinyldiaminopimelate/putrescine aminotransferase
MLGVGLEAGIDAHELAADLLAKGLIVNVPEPGTLRLLPPLTIGDSEIERALSVLGSSLRAQPA